MKNLKTNFFFVFLCLGCSFFCVSAYAQDTGNENEQTILQQFPRLGPVLALHQKYSHSWWHNGKYIIHLKSRDPYGVHGTLTFFCSAPKSEPRRIDFESAYAYGGHFSIALDKNINFDHNICGGRYLFVYSSNERKDKVRFVEGRLQAIIKLLEDANEDEGKE